MKPNIKTLVMFSPFILLAVALLFAWYKKRQNNQISAITPIVNDVEQAVVNDKM